MIKNTKQLTILKFEKNNEGNFIPMYNHADPFIATLLKKNTLSEHAFSELAKRGFGQNTLLAYVLEATSSPTKQAILLKNLFLQIARMYEEHGSVRGHMKSYLTHINKTVSRSDSVTKKISQLFGSTTLTKARLRELATKLRRNDKLSLEDFEDLGIYAFPFNLQLIAQRMQLAYRMSTASTNVR